MSSDRSTTQAAGTGTGTFSAADLKRRMAEREAAKAAEELRRMREHEEKQKAVMEEFHKPPDRSPEQPMQTVMQLVNHAAESGQSEVQVYRFPNALCSDRPKNQQLGARLGSNLGGPAQDGIRVLARSPEAARLRTEGRGARIPGGMPGGIGFLLTWK